MAAIPPTALYDLVFDTAATPLDVCLEAVIAAASDVTRSALSLRPRWGRQALSALRRVQVSCAAERREDGRVRVAGGEEDQRSQSAERRTSSTSTASDSSVRALEGRRARPS